MQHDLPLDPIQNATEQYTANTQTANQIFLDLQALLQQTLHTDLIDFIYQSCIIDPYQKLLAIYGDILTHWDQKELGHHLDPHQNFIVDITCDSQTDSQIIQIDNQMQHLKLHITAQTKVKTLNSFSLTQTPLKQTWNQLKMHLANFTNQTVAYPLNLRDSELAPSRYALITDQTTQLQDQISNYLRHRFTIQIPSDLIHHYWHPQDQKHDTDLK